MRRNLTRGLAVLSLHALAAAASAQGYYYPGYVPYPAQMYHPAMYPTAAPPAAAPKADAPPEGIFPALARALAPKPAVTRVSAPVTASVVLEAPPAKLPLAVTVPPPATPVVPPPAPVPAPAVVSPPVASAPCPEPSGGPAFYGMAGVSVLHANLPSRVAFNQFSAVTALNGTTATTQNLAITRDFNTGVQINPLVVLGVTGDSGLGVRGRFWYYDEGDTQTATNSDPTGATAFTSAQPAPFTIASPGGGLATGFAPDDIRATHNFKATTIDLEGTFRGDLDAFTVLGSLGVRYGYLEQRYAFSRVNAGGTDGVTTVLIDADSSSARHEFEGAGPTASAQLSRPLGGGLSLFALGRGSMLIGRHTFRQDSDARTLVNAFGGVIDTDTRSAATSGSSRVVPIGELEVGAEWSRSLGTVSLIARAGFQVQTWFDGGSLTTPNGNIDFYGGNFLLGLQY